MISDSNKMINRESVASEWVEKVIPVHPVPQKLFDHQLDAMSLLLQGKHVFLGTHNIIFVGFKIF